MAVLGIVAEYNPFHHGHVSHLRSAVSAVSPEAVLVALSGPFTQRGEPALLSPWDRAACALQAGADAVFAMPVLWTVCDAERYTLGAVSLLASLGATHLAFGAEIPDLSLLEKTADFLEHPSSLFQNRLKSFLSEGLGYPAALSSASAISLPETGSVLKHPNNILAVCYLRAIIRLGLHLTPVVIPRSGSYSSYRVDPQSPSASAVREALYRGSWQEAYSALPDFSRSLVQSRFLSHAVPDPRILDTLLLEKLRSMTPADAAALPESDEGLSQSLLKAAARVDSRSALIDMLTSRRYSGARISRLCASVLLGITREMLKEAPLPRGGLMLAMKKNLPLTGYWKNLPVSSSAARWTEHQASPELTAYRLWGQISSLPGGFPYTEKTFTQ